jgi:hypothetical protein
MKTPVKQAIIGVSRQIVQELNWRFARPEAGIRGFHGNDLDAFCTRIGRQPDVSVRAASLRWPALRPRAWP